MNKNNIKYWSKNDRYYAEWSDRALDDDDRYEDDSIILTVSCDAVGDERLDKKNVNTLMFRKYDEWIRETR
jgi:hypothetical protein